MIFGWPLALSISVAAASFLAGILVGRSFRRPIEIPEPPPFSCIGDHELADLVFSVREEHRAPWSSDHDGNVWSRDGYLVGRMQTKALSRLLVVSVVVIGEALSHRSAGSPE